MGLIGQTETLLKSPTLDAFPTRPYVNPLVSTGSPGRTSVAETIGKTVQIRCGAAAVIG